MLMATKAWSQNKSWNILEWLSQSSEFESHRRFLIHLNKQVTANKPNEITDLEVIDHDQWAKIVQECCQAYASCLHQVIGAKGCYTEHWRHLSLRGWIILQPLLSVKVVFCVWFGENSCNIRRNVLVKLCLIDLSIANIWHIDNLTVNQICQGVE